MRILILCPAGLVSNWIDEFAKWNKHRAGITESFVITSTTPASHRLPMLDKWYRKARGSVLIMGYELFRSWALNPSGKRQPFTEDEHKEVKEKLLRGPSIIIADEAHKLKNNESQITKAAKLLRTKSRIALTGSPLSNNLLEYFAMVDWIAPGYLGELVEFKANYVEPIEEGGYLDSTQADRRRARVKRAALIEILEPKIHRKEIDALQGILQAKIQFVLKVPSTEVQTQIYRAFVKLASPGIRDDSVSNAKLWGMMAYLQLLCSHPALFKVAVDSIKRKQLAHQQKKRAKSPIKRVVQLQDEVCGMSYNAFRIDKIQGNRSPAIDDNDTDCSDEMIDDAEDGNPSDLGSLEVAEQVLSELADVFAPILENPLEVDFSNKAKLLLEIVQKSKAVKDKLLIFSHRLHTLDHLSKILDKAGVTWARLDGSTTMNKRQEMTKNFNKDDSCDVFLISTRAGGVGFNLHGANRVVLFDFSFNPTWEEQAIGRAFRLGQKKPVFVYRFISAGTFEDALFNQTVFKLQLAQQVVEKKNTRNKAVRIRDYIKMPQKSHLESLSEGIGHDKILDEIIENMVAGSELIHDLKLDTTFKEEDKETLDEVSRLEMEALVKENQLRNADPEAYRAQMAAKLYGHPSTARAASFNPALAGAATGMYAGFPSTAPMAQMVHPPARSMSSALNVPTAARFPCTGGSNGEPHGLPFASVPSFSIGGRAEPSPLSASTLPGATQNDTTQAQQNSQN
jgi:SNF2 family DNA or RNA helicase